MKTTTYKNNLLIYKNAFEFSEQDSIMRRWAAIQHDL